MLALCLPCGAILVILANFGRVLSISVDFWALHGPKRHKADGTQSQYTYYGAETIKGIDFQFHRVLRGCLLLAGLLHDSGVYT